MATNKTVPTKLSVAGFLNSVENDERRKDAKALLKLIKEVTNEKPKMWGTSIVGFGQYHYRYESGREGDFMRIGFSPRKGNLVVYVVAGYSNLSPLLDKLGKHKIGKSCLYIDRLSDVDVRILKKIIAQGWKEMAAKYPEH